MAIIKYLGTAGLTALIRKVKAYIDGVKAWAQVLFETKQDTLKSGVNVKTVDGQSIVGSGNVNVQDLFCKHISTDLDRDPTLVMPISWGDQNRMFWFMADGTANKPDDGDYMGVLYGVYCFNNGAGGARYSMILYPQDTNTDNHGIWWRTYNTVNPVNTWGPWHHAASDADLDIKQDTLVSGTNIKTINGESLLGSGDMVISGTGSKHTDVTAMFRSNVEIPYLLIEKIDVGNGKIMIRIFGEDISGNNNQLVLTAPPDLGSLYEMSNESTADRKPKIAFGYDNTGTPAAYECVITKATTQLPTTITFDAEVKDIDITYWVDTNTFSSGSYYVTTSGIAKPFSLVNTPINNFIYNSPNINITINGETFNRLEIKEICFDNDYNAFAGAIPSTFLQGCSFMTYVDLRGLKNAVSIGNDFIRGCDASTILMSFPMVRSIGQRFLMWCGTKKIDMSSFTSLTSISTDFLTNVVMITDLQIGGINFSGISTGSGFVNVPTNQFRYIHADTQQLITNFKAKYTATNSWTGVIN